MTGTKEDMQFQQLVQKFDPQNKLIRFWKLKGGVSAQVTALEMERPDGQIEKVIVRQHGEVDLKQNPEIAADEFKLLQILHSAGLATPKPIYLDQSGEIFLTPIIMIEYIEGRMEFAPANLSDCMLQLATHLSRIHKIDGSQLDLSFLRNPEAILSGKLRNRPAKVDESLNEGQIRDILESVWPLPKRNPSVLLHGDYWPGNILWKDGQLVSVIDWEDAQMGDPLADVANSRLEILWAYGLEAMHIFTQHYQSMTQFDLTNLPYWDLCAALRPASKLADWAGDIRIETKMREGHRLFLEQAYEKLSRM